MSLKNTEMSILHLVSHSGHKYLLSIQNVVRYCVNTWKQNAEQKKKIQCCLPQGSSLEFRRENRHAWEKKKHMQITIRIQILTGN